MNLSKLAYLFFSMKFKAFSVFSAIPYIFSAGMEQTAILTPRFNGTAKIKSSCKLLQTASGSTRWNG